MKNTFSATLGFMATIAGLLILPFSAGAAPQKGKELIWYNIPSKTASGFVKGDVKSNRTCRVETKFTDMQEQKGDLLITLTVNGADGYENETRQVRIPAISVDPKTGTTSNLFPLKEQAIKMAKKSDRAYYRNGLLYVQTSPKQGETLELRMNVDEKLIPTGRTEIEHYTVTGAEKFREKILNYTCDFEKTQALHRIADLAE